MNQWVENETPCLALKILVTNVKSVNNDLQPEN
jgi:hypothetical protein